MVEKVGSDLIWLLTVLPVGVVIGGMLQIFRMPSDHLQLPSLRADVVGALLALLLAFSGMFAAIPLGLFFRTIANPNSLDWLHPSLTEPRLPALVVIGTFAPIPHLMMTGRDLRLRSPAALMRAAATKI